MNSFPCDDELLQAYLNGELTAETTAALMERLKADPCLAERLILLAHEEAVLREWARAERAAAASVTELLGRGEAKIGGAGGVSPSASSGTSEGLGLRHRRRGAVALIAAAAVVLAVLALVLGRRPSGRDSEVLARLTSVQGEVCLVTVSGEVRAAREGEELPPGQVVQVGDEGSYATVRYPDGTELQLSPETVLRLEAGGVELPVGKRVFLQAGLVEADVVRQPEDRPMILSTPHAIIRVLGTRFCSAALAEATRVETEEGQVQLTRLSDGQSVVVEKNRFAVAALREEPLQTYPLVPRCLEPHAVLAGQPGPVCALAFSPDGDTLAIAGWDGTIRLWDRRTGEVRLTFKAHPKLVKALAFSPDGSVLATGSMDKVVRFWDPATGAPRPVTFAPQKRDIDVIAFSPDGQLLATALGYGKGGPGSEQIVLWDARTGAELTRLAGHTSMILDLVFAPDGKTLATAGKDGTVKFWDVETRQERASYREHYREVHALAFSPDGQLLATGGYDLTVRLWDTRTGEVRHLLQGHTRAVKKVAFSPDGRLLASTGGDSLVRLWDPATGQELKVLKGHTKGTVPAVAFSPDGRLLATGGWDRRVLLWDMTEQ
ncbi:MAG TPA: FecR domain-containing protein [Gemmataceae bacterium]|nr:FecR domain-containing protein [Gemmataceae bacterium]